MNLNHVSPSYLCISKLVMKLNIYKVMFFNELMLPCIFQKESTAVTHRLS